MERNEDNLTDLWNNTKHANIHIIRVPEGEREKGPEKIFEEVIPENFLNTEEETIKSRKHRESPKESQEEHTKIHSNYN